MVCKMTGGWYAFTWRYDWPLLTSSKRLPVSLTCPGWGPTHDKDPWPLLSEEQGCHDLFQIIILANGPEGNLKNKFKMNYCNEHLM